MRLIDLNTDYDTLCSWWKSYDWPPIPLEALPQQGLIIDGVCAGFIYQTDSSIALMEWIVGNKQSNAILREEKLTELVVGLKSMAKTLGFTTVFSAVKHPNLIKIYENNGLVATDSHMHHFMGATQEAS